MSETKRFGLLAEFDTTRDLYAACEQVRDAGFTHWDAYSPFAVHGLDKAMGMKRSRLPWIILIAGLIGSTFAFLLQWWVAANAYPMIISDKAYFSWQAFIPITFELGVLFAAFAAILGTLGLSKLPQYYHPLFNSDRFARVTDDKFFIAIESTDPLYDERKTAKLLTQTGATHVELVED